MKKLFTLGILIQLSTSAIAAEKGAPTFKDVPYGPHERNILNLWKVESDKPLGILVQIHGGGWIGGQKQETQHENVFKNGYHTASIDYPLAQYGDRLPSMVHSDARAIQFLRSKADEWNIDPEKIMVSGSSAGAASSLWLATHDDLADLNSDDPVSRQSTRVAGAIANAGQTTLDPFLIEERIGPKTLEHNMLFRPVGAADIADLKENWESQYKELSNECTALTHIDADDSPMFLKYKDAVVPAENAGHGIHNGMFGVILKEKADEMGATVYLQLGNEAPEVTQKEFMDRLLLGNSVKSRKL